MDKHFQRLLKLGCNEVFQRTDLFVGLIHIVIPGYGDVAIQVKNGTIFNDTKIMQIDPGFTLLKVECFNEPL
jgi:hypothetical protein